MRFKSLFKMFATLALFMICFSLVSASMPPAGVVACSKAGYRINKGQCTFKDGSSCGLKTYAVDGCASETEMLYMNQTLVNSNSTVQDVVKRLKCDTKENRVDWLVDIHQTLDTGMCRAYFEKYGYDTLQKKCVKFVYGGCGGNANRFSTLQACDQMVHSYELYHMTD